MRILVMSIFAVLILSFSAFAEKGKGKGNGKDISAKKAKMLERINNRIECLNKRLPLLQEHKTCIEAANDKAALGKCRKASKEKLQNLKDTGCGNSRK